MSRIDGNSEALKQLRAELEPVHRDFNRLDAKTLKRGPRLPRLAVVGEASCGKSSVLDAFTHIGFPVKEQNGTLFTTAVILRCTQLAKAEAKVNNGDTKTAPTGSRLQTLERRGPDERDFAGIVDDAKALLRIQRSDGYCPQHGLYIKVSGPDLLPLFITDLPGILWDDEQRNDDDAVLCRELAEREMANTDVVILAVVSAQNGPNALKILDLVKKYDPRGERTLGIITKPDLAVSQADQLKFANLVRNMDPEYRLDLGWHMLRNRPYSGWTVSAEERDLVETEFFRMAPWSSVPPQARGAWMLRLRLGHILQASILKGLPDLSMATEAKMETLDIRLQRLGPPLSTVEEARNCMVKVAAQFQTLLAAALKGDYTDTFFGDGGVGYGAYRHEDTVVRRLRTLMGNLNRSFALVMVNSGAKRHFINSDGSGDYKAQVPSQLIPFVEFYHQPGPDATPREEFIAEVENMIPVNSSEAVIASLFREQAAPWESIATTHIELAKSTVKAFVESTMTHIVGTDNKILGEALRTFVDPFFIRTSMELELKLKELLKHYKEGHIQPHDTAFRRFLFQQQAGLQYRPLARNPDLKSWSIDRTNAEAAVDEMTSYYNFTLQTFTDNVITLVVDNCLISHMPDIITLDRVLELNDEDLQMFVTETEEMKQRRTDIKIERFELKEALSACQKHLDRGFSGVPLVLRPTAGSDVTGIPSQPPSTLSSF
ncbi:P-loop containing nucleoside triphosphate hydrolase protein [Thelonectria olida]|uniref:P-loop containing nucleoside triphosphate hydrolase protein n=1 Tax=Thelonectria olida TaxID=1576542 RepID=A0A9P8WI42_9HYPO|nr:P-loop containing nucleoside triphosphate hydrolase protein [Thelonectria olida]